MTELMNIYHYDKNGYFDYFLSVPKGSELKLNFTRLLPCDSEGRAMYKPKFDMAQNKWVETLTQTEIDVLNKPATPEPTDEQKMISTLSQRVAKINAENVQLKQMVSTLGQTVAQIKARSTTTTN